MSIDNRAMSWDEFVQSGFDGRDYEFPEMEGEFVGTIACKRWNKNNNLMVYMDMDNGDKIVTVLWPNNDFRGMADIAVEARVKVEFRRYPSGKVFVQEVEEL